MTTVYHGSCFCGACEFEYTYSEETKPVFASLCHCRLCRDCTGSSCAHLVGVPRPSFKITKGEPKQYIHPNFTYFNHTFCTECGGHLTQGPNDAPFVAVFPTNFDFGKEKRPEVPEIFKPKAHANFENAILPESFEGSPLPKFKDFPKEMGGSGELL